MGLDQYLRGDLDGELVEIGYWRKANQIHGYMDDLAVARDLMPAGESINTNIELPLDSVDLEMLGGIVRRVLRSLGYDPEVRPDWELLEGIEISDRDAQVAMDLLPPSPGFFFGTYEIDGWYVNDLYETLSILANARDYTDVTYTAWW